MSQRSRDNSSAEGTVKAYPLRRNSGPIKYLGQLVLFAYRASVQLKCKCFSLLIAGSFAHFGRKTVLMCPIRLSGEKRIAIGDGVYMGAGCWLQSLPDGDNDSVAIWIGRGTSIAGACVISAVRHVSLEEEVLLARNVYISDHIHKYTQPDTPILAQGLDKMRPVLIKRGAWLGQNVVVCPGVTIGRGAVIGANSVVNQDIPDFSVAVGAPARIVKTIDSKNVASFGECGALTLQRGDDSEGLTTLRCKSSHFGT